MTHSIDTPTQSPRSGASNASGSQSSTKDVAKDQAANVASTAQQAGGQVAATAADQAKQVTQETKRQAQDMLAEGRSQLQEQARTGQQKAGAGLSDMAQQLRTMVDGSSETPSGPAADLVRQAGDKLEEFATYVQGREPGDLVNDVRAFARRKPGVFLFGAAVAGIVAGRLTTGIVAAHKDDSPSGTGNRQLAGTGSPYATDSYSAGTNYVADTQATGYTTGTVPPPPYGTVPPEGTSVPPTTAAGWDDPARTPGSGRL